MGLVFEIENLKKYYGEETILNEINLRVEAGELLAITGESGCGKTTLLSILGLLQDPSEGRMKINGQKVLDLTAVERAKIRQTHIGFVFQRARLVGSLTALENVLLPAWLFRQETAAVYDRAKQLLLDLGLKKRRHYLPEQLSLGQMRRVALARALLFEPSILLADEPTNDLDPASASIVFEQLKNAQHAGTAVILVTHDMAYASQAERIFELSNGKLQQMESLADL